MLNKRKSAASKLKSPKTLVMRDELFVKAIGTNSTYIQHVLLRNKELHCQDMLCMDSSLFSTFDLKTIVAYIEQFISK
jgi:hypothetical protein